MSQSDGTLQAAVTLGLQSIFIRPARKIADFEAQVTFEEQHEDIMEITEQPVETGAKITDHSYVRPATLTIQCGWSNSPTNSGLLGGLLGAFTGTVAGISSVLSGNSTSQVKKIYQDLLDLQRSRIPFTVVTGKRVYQNMLVRSLKTTTDKNSENSLMVTATFQEVKMVSVNTLTFSAPAENQANPEATDNYSHEGTKNLAPAPNYNSTAGDAAATTETT